MPDDTPKALRSTLSDLALGGLSSAEEYAALSEEVGKSIAAEKKRNRRAGKRQIFGRLPRELLTSADQYVARYADEIEHAAAVLAPTQPHLAVALTLLAQIVSDDDPTTKTRPTMNTQDHQVMLNEDRAQVEVQQMNDLPATLAVNDEIEGGIVEVTQLLEDGYQPGSDTISIMGQLLPRGQRLIASIDRIRDEWQEVTPRKLGTVAKRWIDTGVFVAEQFFANRQ